MDSNGTRTPHERSWWSTRQQLVVVTSDTPNSARTWPERIDDLMWIGRQLIDEWDDGSERGDLDLDRLGAFVEMQRRALHELRRYDVIPT